MFCKICCDVSKVAPTTNTLRSICRFYQTHYEVLNVSRNCTGKDIKSAFIKLSKEHHPDVNKNKKSHERFQQINEAYKVLGKPESRRDYDLGLAVVDQHPHVYRHARYHSRAERYRRNPYHDPLFWSNRDRARDEFYRDQPYYGINGVPRLPNVAILVCCFIFALLGMGVQYLLIMRSHTFKREMLIRKSMETEKVLNQAREAATVNGNTVQLEALRIKLLGKTVNEPDKI